MLSSSALPRRRITATTPEHGRRHAKKGARCETRITWPLLFFARPAIWAKRWRHVATANYQASARTPADGRSSGRPACRHANFSKMPPNRAAGATPLGRQQPTTGHKQHTVAIAVDATLKRAKSPLAGAATIAAASMQRRAGSFSTDIEMPSASDYDIGSSKRLIFPISSVLM